MAIGRPNGEYIIMKLRTILSTAALLACGSMMNALAEDNESGNATTTATVTNVTGTITQLNYDESGTVGGFLLGTSTLLSFPSNVCGGIGSLGAVGNSVTYSGTVRTNSTTSFQSVNITGFTNNTTKATYTKPAAPTPTAYGPTAGSVTQLNYTGSGAIDGFLFTPSGSTKAVFVDTGSGASATLKPLLTVGATVSVTGTTIMEATCMPTGALTVVRASSLLIGGQTIVISGHGDH